MKKGSDVAHRKLIVHGREFWVTLKELADDLGISESEAREIWNGLPKN